MTSALWLWLRVYAEKFKTEGDAMKRPGTSGQCAYCGDHTENWEYVGTRTVWVCTTRECQREAMADDRGAREQAQDDAARDGYERYL